MPFSSYTGSLCVAASALLLAAGHAFAQGSLTEIQPLPGYAQSNAHAVSGNGLTVVGTSGQGTTPDAPTSPVPIMWTGSAGTAQLTGTSPQTGYAYTISSSGNFIAGRLGTANIYRWTSVGGVELLPNLAGATQSIALAISGDATTVVGHQLVPAPTKPYKWTAAGGTVPLAGTSNGGTARGVNADGSIIVGSIPSPASAVRWVSENEAHLFGANGAAYAVNADGTVVVGHVTPPGPGTFGHAYRWVFNGVTSDPPVETDLGVIAGADELQRRSLAQAVSADGSVVVGYSTRYDAAFTPSTYPRSAFMWTSQLGMVELNTYLPTLGFDLTGWDLRSANGISADGSTIVGGALRNGVPRGFVLHLPQTRVCSSSDFNGDGEFGTDADIEAFFLCLAGTCCPTCWHLGADFNADDEVGTDADIEAFFRVLASNPC
jgi:probable HAF family extracellular repeat protein